MRNINKKLTLHKITLRNLNAGNMRDVKGGAWFTWRIKRLPPAPAEPLEPIDLHTMDGC